MTENSVTPASSSPASDIGYADALAELDAILGELDDDGIDIDVLSQRVERAAYLISICRTRISAAQWQVAEIVKHLEPGNPPSS